MAKIRLAHAFKIRRGRDYRDYSSFLCVKDNLIFEYLFGCFL